MKTFTFVRMATTVVTVGLALVQSGTAVAAVGTAPYTVLIKTGQGQIMSCPPSGLSFTDSQLKPNGSYPPETSPAPEINICSGMNAAYLPLKFDTNQTLKVVVLKTVLNGQDQGQNVAGLTGRMTGTKVISGKTFNLSIDFTTGRPDASGVYARSYTINVLSDTSPARKIAEGTYYISNPAALPEPGSLYLVALGVLGLGALTWRRRVSVS